MRQKVKRLRPVSTLRPMMQGQYLELFTSISDHFTLAHCFRISRFPSTGFFGISGPWPDPFAHLRFPI